MDMEHPEWEIFALQNRLLETNAVLVEALMELHGYEELLGGIIGDTHRWEVQKLRKRIVDTICKKTEDYR